MYSEPIPLILAGGQGHRIAHLYPGLPKPAIPIAGRPFIAWILFQLKSFGFNRVFISLGYQAEVMKNRVQPFIPRGMKVDWSIEQAPLGTGGAISATVQNSGCHPDYWLVMNGDSFLAENWACKIAPLKESVVSGSIIAFHGEDMTRYGGIQMESQSSNLISINEKSSSGPGLINAGIYCLPHEWLQESFQEGEVSLERTLIPSWLAINRTLKVITSTAPFIDIGTPESLREAEQFMFLIKKY